MYVGRKMLSYLTIIICRVLSECSLYVGRFNAGEESTLMVYTCLAFLSRFVPVSLGTRVQSVSRNTSEVKEMSDIGTTLAL